MLSTKTMKFINYLPLFHIIAVALLFCWEYYNLRPDISITLITIVLLAIELLISYIQDISYKLFKIKNIFRFKISTSIFISLMMILLLVRFWNVNIFPEIIDNSYFTLSVLFFSFFIDKVGKPLINASIKNSLCPIHFNNIEVKNGVLRNKINDDVFIINDSTLIKDGDIDKNDIFSVVFGNRVLMLRDCPSHKLNSSIKNEYIKYKIEKLQRQIRDLNDEINNL